MMCCKTFFLQAESANKHIIKVVNFQKSVI